jgi:hypothetical protein
MEQRPSSEADSHEAGQKIMPLSWKPEDSLQLSRVNVDPCHNGPARPRLADFGWRRRLRISEIAVNIFNK